MARSNAQCPQELRRCKRPVRGMACVSRLLNRPGHWGGFCLMSPPFTSAVSNFPRDPRERVAIRVTWTQSSAAPTVCLRLTTFILPAGLVASLLVMLVPMPSALMDLLLSANIAVAVVMLLTTVYVRSPLELSIFPSLLLATTLARLVLNIATTRLILTRADSLGLDAAGGVVRAFGEFVAGDRIVVGLIIFLIIIVVQFVVITKGATRISEVAARFAPDGMPGRQMAIDADLTAGLIDEKQAATPPRGRDAAGRFLRRHGWCQQIRAR